MIVYRIAENVSNSYESAVISIIIVQQSMPLKRRARSSNLPKGWLKFFLETVVNPQYARIVRFEVLSLGIRSKGFEGVQILGDVALGQISAS